MKILLTGATGYIGQRLLPVLVNQGHYVVCCVRDKQRFNPGKSLLPFIEAIEADLLEPETLATLPPDLDAAYYLVHSMSISKDYQSLEVQSADNFVKAVKKTQIKQVIYLSGIVNDQTLSQHLNSRKLVEAHLQKGSYHLTTLRAGIIIGSGSASFEIIRDLVEKLPVMIAPKWLNTRCQPIAISDVIYLLAECLGNKATYDKNFDIGGPDILTYKQMLLGYARVRKLGRKIFMVPVMTPRLSSYWLYFVTSTSYKLASALVDSMKIEVVCRDSEINDILDLKPLGYEQALQKALSKIERNEIISSWKDSFVSGGLNFNTSDFLKVPDFGCFKDLRTANISDRTSCIQRIWRIGGNTGWYYASWLWELRGFIDKIFGGVGLRRGRTHETELHVGDAIDFWRVLYANKEEGRLLLFAEMKLPGEAWLEFKIENQQLIQTATFRPKGILGRLYWFGIYPFHGLIFGGMVRHLSNRQ